MFLARTTYFVALFLRQNYREKRKSALLLWSLKKEIRRQDKVGGMEKESKEGNILPFLSFTVSVTLGHIFFWLWYMWVCVCIGCSLSYMWDPATDVTFLPVKAAMSASHTHLCMHVTRWSYRKCVFPFTILLLLPIKSTKENVIHSCCQTEIFSPHFSESASSDSEKKVKWFPSTFNLNLGHS